MRYPRVLKALGNILLLFSLTLLIPLLGSLAWDEGTPESDVASPLGGNLRQTTLAYFATLLLAIFLGLFLVLVPREDLEELREREAYAIVGFAWILLAIIGALPFLLVGVTRSPTAALFESMSGLTTTGATALALPLEQFPPSMHLWRNTLQMLGGMGIIVLSVALIQRMTEGAFKLMSMEAPGGTVTRLKPKLTETAKALWTIYISLIALMFLILLPLIHFQGRRLPWDLAAFEALATALSALSTGGFHPHTDSIAYYGSSLITWTVMLFMLVGGVNFSVYWVAMHGRPNVLWRDSQTRTFLAVVGIGAIIIAATLRLNGTEFWSALEAGAFQTTAFITTTGYTSANHNGFPDAAKMVLILAMFTGACSGSTAGGFKILRIQLLWKLTLREVQKLLHPHAVATVKLEGRVLPDETMRRVIVFFFSYLIIFLIGSFGYLALGYPIVDSTSTSLSLVGNVGPSFGALAFTHVDAGGLAHILGFFLMWLGRLEIFTALLLFVPATYRD